MPPVYPAVWYCVEPTCNVCEGPTEDGHGHCATCDAPILPTDRGACSLCTALRDCAADKRTRHAAHAAMLRRELEDIAAGHAAAHTNAQRAQWARMRETVATDAAILAAAYRSAIGNVERAHAAARALVASDIGPAVRTA